MHGAALRAELGQPDDFIHVIWAETRWDVGFQGSPESANQSPESANQSPESANRSLESANQSPESTASIPTVPKVSVVQSMGPCLMSL